MWCVFRVRHSRPSATHEGRGILNKSLLILRFPFFFVFCIAKKQKIGNDGNQTSIKHSLKL